MPWKCPACQSQIAHSELETKPRPSTSYRCHICRLELFFDSSTNRMTVAPMRDDENEKLRPSGSQSDDGVA